MSFLKLYTWNDVTGKQDQEVIVNAKTIETVFDQDNGKRCVVELTSGRSITVDHAFAVMEGRLEAMDVAPNKNGKNGKKEKVAS